MSLAGRLNKALQRYFTNTIICSVYACNTEKQESFCVTENPKIFSTCGPQHLEINPPHNPQNYDILVLKQFINKLMNI